MAVDVHPCSRARRFGWRDATIRQFVNNVLSRDLPPAETRMIAGNGGGMLCSLTAQLGETGMLVVVKPTYMYVAQLAQLHQALGNLDCKNRRQQ